MANLYVANPQPPEVLLSPIVGEDMSADFLYTPGSGYSLRIDPASDVENTHSAQGALLKLKPAAAPPSAATLFAYDAVSKKLKIAVDGQATPLEVDLGALDDEGAKLVLNGQNLELQSASGTVLSSTPITQIDAQTLTGTSSAGEYKIALSNGGEIVLTCTDITSLYADGTATARTRLLSNECTTVQVDEIPIATAQLQPGPLPSGVTVPGSAISSPITNPAATVPAANIVGPLPASLLPPTTNTLTIAAGELVSTVDGVVAKTALSTIVTCDAVKAAFATVSAPTPTMNLLNDACGKVKLKQDVSATGRLLPTWSVVA